jgi:ABC-type antimicrobial peptide transport system permease subunit
MIFFALITLFISCLGLLGLAGLRYELRIKEISVRKVLGANSSQLFLLLMQDFTKRILLAFALVIPAIYLVVNQWLANFEKRIYISPYYFILSALVILVLAWITIAFLTIKTVRINPADSLKAN